MPSIAGLVVFLGELGILFARGNLERQLAVTLQCTSPPRTGTREGYFTSKHVFFFLLQY